VSHDIVVILSTHIVSDVAVLCSRMAVIDRGRIVADTTPGEAVARLEGKVFEGTVPSAHLAQVSATHRILSRMVATPDTVRVKVYAEGGPPGAGFRPATGVLEDAYFSLVGEAGGRA
jgi:ABC-type multidrug transport system ATPase subunit